MCPWGDGEPKGTRCDQNCIIFTIWSQNLMMKPTTLITMTMGTTARMSSRKLGISSTTPAMIGYRVALMSKSVTCFHPLCSHLSSNLPHSI